MNWYLHISDSAMHELDVAHHSAVSWLTTGMSLASTTCSVCYYINITFFTGDNLTCHPVKNVIFIFLYQMSHFYNTFQCYMMTESDRYRVTLYRLITFITG